MAFLSDIWFYAYGAGLFVGIGLFVFLRARFNSAVAGPDSSDLAAEFERRMRAAGMEPEPVKVVTGHPEEAKPKVAAAEPSKPAPPPAAAPSPAPEKKPETGGLTGKTMIGGVSPAIVYLQNLKMQIEHFEKEIQQLRGDVSGFVQKHDSQYSNLLKRLGDLQSEMHHQAPPASPSRPAAQAKAPAAAATAPAAPQAPRPSPQPVAAPSTPKAAEAVPVVEVLSPVRVPQEAPAPKPVPPAIETTAPIPVQAAAVAVAAHAPPPPPADESMSLRPPDENAGKGKAPIWPV